MTGLTDTIVAPITATGGAVAIVRLSGPRSVQIAGSVCDVDLAAESWKMISHTTYVTGDDGLAVAFEQGHSYTGEETVELSVHGSQASVNALVDQCLKSGARFAEPGEFTYRAFMNGRLDLTQAEGVRDTVNAKTGSQLRQANLMRDGSLRERVSDARKTLIGALAAVEAATDFSEEIGDLDRGTVLATVEQVIDELNTLYSTVKLATVIREGATVAIIGRPNVGKSSLLNAVTSTDRAIVTAKPGTTRDTVSELVEVNGLAVKFVDTAGMRETSDEVERLGVERSRDAAESADHVWFVFDGSAGWLKEDEFEASLVNRPVTYVANKCDLPAHGTGPHQAVLVSAKSGEGIGELLNLLSSELTQQSDFSHGEVPLVNRRHAPLLEEAMDSLRDVQNTLISPVPDDLASVGLRSAVRALGEITGETAPPDIIERVFHDFCIGK